MQDIKNPKVAGMQILLSGGIFLAVLVIVLGFTMQVTAEIRDDMTPNSTEYNATNDGIEGISNITEKTPTIGLILAIIVIIGLIVGLVAFAKTKA